MFHKSGSASSNFRRISTCPSLKQFDLFSDTIMVVISQVVPDYAITVISGGYRTVNVWLFKSVSSHAGIMGMGSANDSLPALFFFFFLVEISSGASTPLS